MKKYFRSLRLIFIILSLPALSLYCQTSFNLNMEHVTSSVNLPSGWFRFGPAGYTLTADSLEKHSGHFSIRIEPGSNSGGSAFGSCATKIPAAYEGRQIELRGYMKIKDVTNGNAGLLLRIDGESSILQFDNMLDRHISGTVDWKEYSIVLPYPDDARTIYAAAILQGNGTIWADDLRLFIDGKNISEAPKKISRVFKADLDHEFDNGSNISHVKPSDKIIDDLTLLGKIWGFVKYYHPAVASGQYNWDYELFRIMPSVINSRDKHERNTILFNWIKSIGEISKTTSGEIIDTSQVRLFPDLGWIEDSSELNDSMAAFLGRIRDAVRKSEHYYLSFVPNAGNPVFNNEIRYSSLAYPDAGIRILSLFRYWNIIQYLSPYKYLTDGDWNKVLKEFLPKFIIAQNELEYKLALLELITKVKDTHANIWGSDKVLDSYKGINIAPLTVRFIEKKPVITGYYDEQLGQKSGLKKGDIILRINDERVSEVIKRKLPYTPGSNTAQQMFRIALDLLRSNDSSIKLSYERNGKVHEKMVDCCLPEKLNLYQIYQQKKSCWKFLKREIGYIYPGSIMNDSLAKIMSDFNNTKGIVIDMRCYPSEFIGFSLAYYLLPRPADFVKFTKTTLNKPGLFTFSSALKAGGYNKNHYKGKIVILVDETTQSQAEYTAMSFRSAPNALVIGSTSSGADGNVSPFDLPGGIKTMITGIGIYYPDGRETQGVGIIPDIKVLPTVKGISENKDEQLEKAIELIESEAVNSN